MGLMFALSIMIFNANAQTSNNTSAPTSNVKQPGAKVEEKAKVLTDLMVQYCNLSEEQGKATYAINLKYMQQRVALKNSGATKEELATKNKELNKQKEAELKTIFSAEQFKVLQANKSAIKAKFKEKYKQNASELDTD